MMQLVEQAVSLIPFSAEQSAQYLREMIVGELESVLAADGAEGVRNVTDRLGCLLAAIAAQTGGPEGLKIHLDNSERYGRDQLQTSRLWTAPRLP